MSNALEAIERQLQQELGAVVVGMQPVIRALAIAVVARGHVLLQGAPGLGKTLLSKSLATVLGGTFKRVQGTSDLMPADITGVHVFDGEKREFVFRPGPVFADVLLVDEVNRAGPKTQSALLEAMEERQVTVDRHNYSLPPNFLVIATQNPREFEGTYPLPESQLDRFLLRIQLGYPDAALERQLLLGQDRRDLLATLGPTLSPQQLLLMQTMVPGVYTSDALLDYVQAIVRYTRESPHFESGISPRAAIALLRAAQAWALIHGHTGVQPEDVQAVLGGVVGHRLKPRSEGGAMTAQQIGAMVLKAVEVP